MKKANRIAAIIIVLSMLLSLLPLCATAAVKITAPKQLYVDIGGTAQIEVKAATETSLSTLPITYKSGNKNIATVDEAGTVSGVAKGATTVSVTYGKQILKVQVYVCESLKPYTCPSIFSIDYPASWEVKENALQSEISVCKAAFLTPRQSAQDMYRENVQITLESLPESPRLATDDYLTALIAAGKLISTNYKLVSTKKITFAGMQGRILQYTCTFGQFKIKTQHQFYVYNNTAYVISYAAEQKNYDQFTIEVQRMLNSYQKLN